MIHKNKHTISDASTVTRSTRIAFAYTTFIDKKLLDIIIKKLKHTFLRYKSHTSKNSVNWKKTRFVNIFVDSPSSVTWCPGQVTFFFEGSYVSYIGGCNCCRCWWYFFATDTLYCVVCLNLKPLNGISTGLEIEAEVSFLFIMIILPDQQIGFRY